ncbi:MAG: polyketide synthase dehydratase domain-containing protein, partial [Planctomycetota bacterium]
NCNAPSDEIDWSWPVEIPVKGSSWDGEASTRTAGVSSFGFGGSNAHIVMSGHLATPIDEQSATPADSGSNPTVMVLSAKSARALSQQAVRYADAIQQMPDADFHDIAATSACCRSHFNVRAAWIVNSIDSLVDQLRAFGDTGELQAPGDASNDPLQNLCQQYRNGEAIDWKATFTKPFRRVNLPTYAFERKRRWFANETLTWTPRLPDSQSGAPSVADQSTVAIASSAVTNRDAHPFLRDRITPADGDGQVLIQAIINPCELSHAFVRDHQVRGSILFPAAGLLDLMIAIGQRESESAMDVVDFEVRRPVKLRDDQPVALQIKLTPEHDNYGAAIFMQRNGSRQTRWHQVASCRLVPTVISNARDHHQNFYQVTSSNQSSTWRHSIDASWYQADTELPVDAAHTNAIAHYESLHHVGLQYGPAFQGLLRRAEMAVDENQIAVATVSLPAGLIHAGFAMHPAMLDACLQAAAGLIPDPTSIWIPASVDRLAICGEFQADEEATVLAAALPTQQANQQSFDFRILDRQQNTVAIVDGLTVQRLSAKSAASSSSKLSSTTERPNEKKDARPNDSGRISSISAGNDNSTAPPQATSQTHSLENVTDKDALRQRLHHRVAEILDTDINDVPLEDPLDGLGLDSLMAFELRDEVDKHFGIEIPLELFFQSVSLGQFLDTIVSQITTNQSQQPAQSQQRMGDDDSSDRRKHFVEGTL